MATQKWLPRPLPSPSSSEDAEAAQKEATKIRQVAQHFFTKAALTVITSRLSLPPTLSDKDNKIKSDRWFNLILDESEVLTKDLAPWVDLDVNEARPPPLVIDIYLDPGELPRNQTLVVVDERGSKWDAIEAIESNIAARSGGLRSRRAKSPKIILERWKIQLARQPESLPTSSRSAQVGGGGGFNDSMANVYKKGVVLFRSLYTYSRMLPAWKFGRRLAKQPPTLTALRPMYQIHRDDPEPNPVDLLGLPLYPSPEPTTQKRTLIPVKSPVGALSIEVSYRSNCNFLVDDSEAMLSSHFLGIDSPTIRGGGVSGGGMGKEGGSLPESRHFMTPQPGNTQAYGSLSTFHQIGPPTGKSPISALRAAQQLNSESPAASSSSRPGVPNEQQPQRRQASGQSASSKPMEGINTAQRRISISLQPFKAGSLSSSPVPASPSPLSARPSSREASNPSSMPGHTRNQSSQTSGTSIPVRAAASSNNEVALGSPSSPTSKPPPMSRYSSSFGHRRSRLSSGGGAHHKGDEDNASSGRGSQASSNQPGSGLMVEGEGAGRGGPGAADVSGGGSSGSAPTEDDNISDFINILEQKKELKSLNKTDDAARNASTKRTTAALTKFQRMRDSHTALSDSLSSSLMQQQQQPRISPPSSSSRNASSNPPQLAGASVSTSSSPNKPLSPHTPHTPAVPSRLSTHATISPEDPQPHRQIDERLRSQPTRSSNIPSRESADRTREQTSSALAGHEQGRTQGSTAIDIPMSPQQDHHYHTRGRRSSSSVAQTQRVIEDEFGMRSASVPIDDRPDLSLSELFALQEPPGQQRQQQQQQQQPQDSAREPSLSGGTNIPQSDERARGEPATVQPNSGDNPFPFRSRFSRSGFGGRGSSSSVGTGGTGSGSGGRYSFSARPGAVVADDDEPLLFTMSELGNQSRKSYDETSSGGGRGVSRERGADGSAGSGPVSRRGSRRGV